MDDLVKYLITPLLSENNLEELAKQLGNLYHFTNFNGLASILDSNRFIGSTAKVSADDLDFKSFRKDAEFLKNKEINFLHFFSTTRDKLLYLKDPKIKGSTVRIVLDGDKLSNQYKVSPFYFYHDEMIDEPNPKYEQDESEERINLGTKKYIPNAKNYIKEIHIVLDKIEDNQDYILKVKNLVKAYPEIKCFYKEKPITIDQYESMFSNKQEINENVSLSNIDFKNALASLTKYMIDNGMNVMPLPKLIIINNDLENANNILGKTAHYDPNNCSITLFTLNRHPKDILRSYAHEMIHRIQDNEGRLNNINTTNTNEDGNLEELEKEAYLNGNMTFRNWEDSLKNSKPVNEVYFLDVEKFNYPRTIHEDLWHTLNEIILNPNSAVEINGNLTRGKFQVGNIIYEYDIKIIPNPYNDGGNFANISFYPEGDKISTPTGTSTKENYIKILSTMYKIILNFAEEAEPDYVGISSMDNTSNKNYHMVYANLTDNKFNRIPGYFRKDVNLPFETPQGKGRMVVLKRKN
jgi:hypothetical protein